MDDTNKPPDQDQELRGLFPRSYESMVARHKARTAAGSAPSTPAATAPAAPARSSTSSPAPGDQATEVRSMFPRSGERMLRDSGHTGDAPVPPAQDGAAAPDAAAATTAAESDEQLEAKYQGWQTSTWEKAGRADAEVGGASYDASMETARNLVQRISPELAGQVGQAKTMNPDWLRFLVRVDRALRKGQ